ncbi:MAG TPA: hypothetical protein VFX37_03555 [Pseudolabrys sp.]|nr:hypothetical protein [Pseudolabrys sp.]
MLIFACVCAGILLSAILAASAQEQENQNPPAIANPDRGGFFTDVGRWFDQQFAKFNTDMKDTQNRIDNFGREADAAAKNSANAAKDAADALARLPNAKIIRIHSTCALAPNGAPDCESVAMRVCKAHGYRIGKSVDMTTAEKCPARVWVSGRSPAPGECTTETFVSRVLCN